jgi:AcrR family transcriptional regulator
MAAGLDSAGTASYHDRGASAGSAVAKAKAKVRAKAAAPDTPLKERILHAAFGAFIEKGYEGTSTLEIATRAKVSKRELYALFRTKQEMFAAGVAARARRMHGPLDLPLAHDVGAFERTLADFGTTFLREACSAQVIGVWRLAAVEAVRSPELARIIDVSGREPNVRALVDFLTQAQSSGIVGGDPDQMCRQFFALLSGDLLLRLILRVAEPPGETEIERRAQAATRALITLYPAKR